MLQDLRYGLRMFGKTPGLTAILAFTLALGMGVNTAIFSALNGWLLRPLPVRAPEQIMVLASQQKERGGNTNFSYADLVDYRKQAGAFSDLFAYRTVVGGLTFHDRSDLFACCDVSGDYFAALGAESRDILKLVARQRLQLVYAGLAIGLLAADALTRAMASLLIGISATDPLTYAMVAILLSAITLVACWIPACRALRIDPMVALRYE